LCGCTALLELPDNMLIGRFVNLGLCYSLKRLATVPPIDGSICLTETNGLTCLPVGFTVQHDLEIHNCAGITALPEGLIVKNNLRLEDLPSIQALPHNIRVKEHVVIKHCPGLAHLNVDDIRAATGARYVILDSPY
jgi:hypothetical protein